MSQAHAVLDLLGLRASSLRYTGGRENRHWRARTDAGRVVLRRSAARRDLDDVDYELAVIGWLAARGWPVPEPVAPPVAHEGHAWCAFRWMPGRHPSPVSPRRIREEQRARGRTLARLHADLAEMPPRDQRQGWIRQDQLFDAPPDGVEVLARWETRLPEEVGVLRAHLDRTRALFASLDARAGPFQVIHGDLAPWNIKVEHGTLSAILDFELAHLDLRVADFALSWRGRHDEVVHGYLEVTPLDARELALMTPVRWAWILKGAIDGLARGRADLTWEMNQIVRRSPLMITE